MCRLRAKQAKQAVSPARPPLSAGVPFPSPPPLRSAYPPPPQVVLDDGMLEAAARLGLLRPDFDAGETRTHRCMRAWMHASMHAYVRNRRRRERAERVIMRAKRRGEERRGERQSDSETEIERQGDREKRGQACVCAMRYV